jgi:regulator of sirC expression with transglutaminase-like and TPR domain
MPITLAIVAIGVARRVGVELAGVSMPGHFLIGDPVDPDWFTDPFTGAIGIGRSDCRDLATTMGHTNWSDGNLAPAPSRLIIARVLNNLRATCERRHDVVRLAIVMQLRHAMHEFASESVQARQSLAVFN